jgi:hypothetical protein
MRIATVVLGFALLSACSKSSTPATTTPAPTEEPKPASDGGDDQRPSLTAAACEGQGGKVVGDIGDGAVHRPDYRCEGSGEAPIGSIVADPGGPVAIEGAVCCK